MLNVIANIKSGKGRGIKNTHAVVKYCVNNGIPFSLHITNKPGHATEIARALTQNGGTIVALGGDGTFHEVLNGIVDIENTALGFIPSGRGNDFVRALGCSLDPIEALEDVLRGKKKRIDYIQVNDKRCLNVCGTGLDVAVLRGVEGKSNKISYVISLIHCLKTFKSYKLKVKVNGETHDFDCIMAGVANGIAFGGNIRLAPTAILDDGKLDVIVMQYPEDGKIMKVLPKFIKGKHMNMPITHHFLCDEVSVEGDYPVELDGEIYEGLKLDCKIVKGGLTTFVPRS